MTLERQVPLSVFAIGALIAVVALLGCGGEGSNELSQACGERETAEHDYAAQGPGFKPGTVRMTYANSSPITPCAATLDDSRLTLHVLEPEVSIEDLRVHCAEVKLEGLEIDALEDGTSEGDQFGADQRVLEDALKGDCARVPLID